MRNKLFLLTLATVLTFGLTACGNVEEIDFTPITFEEPNEIKEVGEVASTVELKDYTITPNEEKETVDEKSLVGAYAKYVECLNEIDEEEAKATAQAKVNASTSTASASSSVQTTTSKSNVGSGKSRAEIASTWSDEQKAQLAWAESTYGKTIYDVPEGIKWDWFVDAMEQGGSVDEAFALVGMRLDGVSITVGIE